MTGVQTCALPISIGAVLTGRAYAQTWVEVDVAGETLTTFQNTIGSGTVSSAQTGLASPT